MEDTSSISLEQQVGFPYCTCNMAHFRRCTLPAGPARRAGSRQFSLSHAAYCMLSLPLVSSSALEMFLSFLQAQTGAPCLSFDIIRDSLGTKCSIHLYNMIISSPCHVLEIFVSAFVTLGENRTSFPLTCYLVAGTQAEPGRQNFLILMKMFDLMSTHTHTDEVEGKKPSTKLCLCR